jgi:hypothetical protein
MRAMAAVTVVLWVIGGAHGQAGDKGKTIKRYGIEMDAKKFPQGTPKDALASVLKSIADNRVNYLLAHLVDPDFTDKRVENYAGKLDPALKEETRIVVAFDRLVKETIEHFLADPSKVRELKRFLEDGEWDEQDRIAIASLKNLKSRRVFMKRIGDDRWVLQDREK